MTMTSNGKDQLRRGAELESDRPQNPQTESQTSTEPEDDSVSALLGFVRWNADNDAPVTDAQADYVLRMTEDMVIPAERLARVRERVLGPQGERDSASPSSLSNAIGRPPDGSPAFEEVGVGRGGESTESPTEPADIAAPRIGRARAGRPSFWRRCRELKLKIDDVLPQLHLNKEILLELEQGRARSVPGALLLSAAPFVDFDASTLARCFAPNSGDMTLMAAHDQSGRAPVAPQLHDFLSIIEDSELPQADKDYWVSVVRADAAVKDVLGEAVVDLALIRRRARELRNAALTDLTTEGKLVTPDALLDAVVATLEIDVVRSAPGSRLLGTARAKLDRERPVIIVDRTLPDEARRFSTAHEIGHFVLDHPAGASEHSQSASVACDAADLDDAPVAARFPTGEAYVTGYSPRQRQEVNASLFAAELLAPIDDVRAAFVAGLSASAIALKNGVSRTVAFGQLAAGLLHADPSSQNLETERVGSAVTSVAYSPPRPLTSLHPKQAQACQALPGPTAVDAGPGTGKTRTLAERVVYLVRECGVASEHVLCLTFSNKAAEEMNTRITRSLGRPVRVQTFHAYGLDLLRDYPAQAGVRNDVTLLDNSEAQELLEQHVDELELDEYRHISEPGLYFDSILDAISRAKDEMVSPVRYAELAAAAQARAGTDEREAKAARRHAEVARVYSVYERLLEQHGLVDFGDLIYRVVRLFEAHPEVARAEAERHPHVLVDEYQDVNRASARLLQLLRPDGRGLWVVGDVRQAIYRFRGASPRNFRDFRRDFPEAAEAIPLVRNYRSAPALVEVFSSVAKAMRYAPGFSNWESERADAAGPIIFGIAPNEEAEVEAIGDRILSLHGAGRSFGDFAILCHRNQDVQRVALALESRNIPVANFGEFFERTEVRDLLSVMAFVVGDGAAALPRVARMMPHVIAPADLAALLTAAVTIEGGLAAVLRSVEPPAGVTVEAFLTLQRDWKRLSAAAFRRQVWTFLADYLFEDGRYLRPLATDHSHVARQRRQAIGQLLLLARAFDARHSKATRNETVDATEAAESNGETATRDVSVEDTKSSDSATRAPSRGGTLARKREFLRFVRRMWASNDRRIGVPVTSSDAVFVGTIHSSKGLEFPIVFMPFLAEGRFPFDAPFEFAPPPQGLMSEEEPNADEAELEALFFVAMTRAQDGLILSMASDYGGKQGAKPSRLLRLIGPAREAQLLAEEHWDTRQVSQAVVDGPRRPFEVESLTYRAYESFLRCPRQFFYRHVLDLPEENDGRAYLPYVVACRSVLNWLEQSHRQGALPNDWPVVEREFASQWDARGPTGHAHERFYRIEALRFVRREWDRRIVSAPTPPWLGNAVAEIDGIRVTIPVEATQHDGATVRVAHRYFRPFKAAKKDYLEPRFALLRLALAQSAPNSQVVIEAHYTDQIVEIAPLRKKDERSRIEAFRTVAARINAGDFPAEPDGERERVCPRCAYAFTCPAWVE